MIWIVMGILAVVAVVLLMLPVVRRSGQAAGGGLAVYRDQLTELEAESAAGLIDGEAAATAKREIERRILAEADRTGSAKNRLVVSSFWPLTLASLLVVGLGGWIYTEIGSPGLGDLPLSSRSDVAQTEDDSELAPLILRAEGRVGDNPFDLEGWVLLANTYAFANRYDDAARAMAEAVALDMNVAANLSRYGEFVTLSRGGVVTPAARIAFAQAQNLDSSEPIARYYEGVARAQDGDVAGALVVWRALMAKSSADAPWLEQLGRHITEAEAQIGALTLASEPEGLSGPTEEDIAAAAEMAPDAQLEMIRSMVDGLAERLEDEPDNLEGWSRLAQSYGVLGQWQASRDAYDHALTLAPDDLGLLDGFANSVAGFAMEAGMVPDQSLADMERVLLVLPQNEQGLYITGLAAAQAGDRGLARERWTLLRDLFPAGSPEYGQADLLINSLQ
ncbi:MAG: c-type cytochrome biogenesis protein CcmI [Alphaproteobacteria bacterium]|nr:c-type cytochrome biogenesis protein CcmI [Alphaproteobacteria bacterium]